MLIRILSVALSLTLAGVALGATGELIAPVLCTITGTVQAPPSSPHDSMYTSKRLAACRMADTMMVFVPVPSCTVWALTPISSRQFFGITDNAGRYRIDSIPVSGGIDSVTIVARKNGYAESRQTVVLLGKDSVTADFSLKQVATGIGSERTVRIGRMLDASIAVYSLDGRRIDGQIHRKERRHENARSMCRYGPGIFQLLR